MVLDTGSATIEIAYLQAETQLVIQRGKATINTSYIIKFKNLDSEFFNVTFISNLGPHKIPLKIRNLI